MLVKVIYIHNRPTRTKRYQLEGPSLCIRASIYCRHCLDISFKTKESAICKLMNPFDKDKVYVYHRRLSINLLAFGITVADHHGSDVYKPL